MNKLTLEKVMKLTPEEIRVKVAEACGFSRIYTRNDHQIDDDGSPIDLPEHDYLCGRINGALWPVPDYTGDLNAIHAELRNVSTAVERMKFIDALASLQDKKDGGEYASMSTIWFLATAEPIDLCRAFLLVKGTAEDSSVDQKGGA